VVGYASNETAAKEVVASIERKNGKAIAVKCDVADEKDILALFKAADDFGTLGALINNAGIVGPSARVEEMSAERIQRMMAVNVTGSILCAREAVKRMAGRNGGPGGAIVNVSSMSATIGGRPGAAFYAASKAAVDTLTVGLAKEVAGEGVRVNAVRPGMTLTDMTAARLTDPVRRAEIDATIPMHRPATPDEVAAPILWLLSDEASFVSGCLLDVSGGGFVVGAPRPGGG